MDPLYVKNFINRLMVRTALIYPFVIIPVTFAYISCPIITEAVSEGIITGGLTVFLLIFICPLSLGWLCLAGGPQEIYFSINDKRVNIGWLNWSELLCPEV
jgi:ferredoxin-type protein NapH